MKDILAHLKYIISQILSELNILSSVYKCKEDLRCFHQINLHKAALNNTHQALTLCLSRCKIFMLLQLSSLKPFSFEITFGEEIAHFSQQLFESLALRVRKTGPSILIFRPSSTWS